MRVCLHKHFGLAQGDMSDVNIAMPPNTTCVSPAQSTLRAHTVFPKGNKSRQ